MFNVEIGRYGEGELLCVERRKMAMIILCNVRGVCVCVFKLKKRNRALEKGEALAAQGRMAKVQ